MKACIILFIFAVVGVALADEDSRNPDTEVSDAVSRRQTRATGCSYDGCNQFCRKLGHARGVCIGSYCQCRFRRRRSISDIEPLPVTDVQPSRQTRAAGCDSNGCNQFCRKLGHARGVCIGSYCQCRSRFRRSTTDIEPLSQASESIVSRQARASRFCGYNECNEFCRKMGYARGVCIGSYCQCRSRL